MRKIRLYLLSIFFVIIFLFSPLQANAEEREVYLGGMAAGFTLQLNGIQVVGITELIDGNQTISPANEAGLKVGDLILSANDKSLSKVNDLEEEVGKGECIRLMYRRGDDTCQTDIEPIFDRVNRQYKIGILIRDCVSGIGTVTCIEPDSMRFGSLGHPVLDEDREKMTIAEPYVYRCSIVGVAKGLRGRAGELKGLFLKNRMLGKASINSETGIFGIYDKESISDLEKVHVQPIQNVKPGKAEIVTTIDGVDAQKYTVEIVKVDSSNEENKNFVIKITDKRLLEETGGIVQGMSGSPILQNGKLIGAVTHVFLNDPSRGYGIGIEKMFGM